MTDNELYQAVIDTYKHTGKNMTITRKEHKAYQRLSSKGMVYVVMFPSGTGYVGLTDKGIEALTSPELT